jgi:hypothetical protein
MLGVKRSRNKSQANGKKAGEVRTHCVSHGIQINKSVSSLGRLFRFVHRRRL